MKYTIILTGNFTPSWLAMTRPQRNAFEAAHVAPILAKYSAHVNVRMYDAESFAADYSDFMILECDDLKYYYFLMTELRDCALLTDGHLQLKSMEVGIENGFAHFDAEAPQIGANR